MENNTDYTVQELFGMLMADESWEKDPQMRQGIAMGLIMSLGIY